jgi:hypothetical protein
MVGSQKLSGQASTSKSVRFDWKKKFLPWTLKGEMNCRGKGTLTVTETSLFFASEKGGDIVGVDISAIRAMRAYKISAEPRLEDFVPEEWLEKWEEETNGYKSEIDAFRKTFGGESYKPYDDRDYVLLRNCKNELERLDLMVRRSIDPNVDSSGWHFSFSWGNTISEDVREMIRNYASYDAESVKRIASDLRFDEIDPEHKGNWDACRYLVQIVFYRHLLEWREMPALGLDVAYSCNGEIKNLSFTIANGQLSESGETASAYSFTRRILGLNQNVLLVGGKTLEPDQFQEYIRKWRDMLERLRYDGKDTDNYDRAVTQIWEHAWKLAITDESMIQNIWVVIMELETLKKDLEQTGKIWKCDSDTNAKMFQDGISMQKFDRMVEKTEYLKRFGLLTENQTLDELSLV